MPFSRHLTFLALVLAVILTAFGGTGANVLIQNPMTADFDNGNKGIEVYEYGTGTLNSFSSNVEFAQGTLTDTEITDPNGDADHEVTLEIRWWDQGWGNRSCFDVAIPLPQFPVKVTVDTSIAATDDVRVVEHIESDPTNTTPVPHYTEWRVDPTQTVVWFQADSDTTYCVYFNNSSNPGSTSNEFAPFTYTSGQTISYYSLQGTARKARVVSYVDNNTVSDGNTTVTLNAGQDVRFNSTNRSSVITATGPVEVVGTGTKSEAYVPSGFADTRITIPLARQDQRLTVRSLGGATTIELYSNGVLQAVLAADGTAQYWNPPGDPRYVTLVSNPPTPFVVMAESGTLPRRIVAGVPWLGEPLYGVPSTQLNVGGNSSHTVNWQNSDGDVGTLDVSAGTLATIVDLALQKGTAQAYRISGNQYFAANQENDRDGGEETAFLPYSLLSRTFILPSTARYLAFACPTPGTMITVGARAPEACNGISVGKLHVPSNGNNFDLGTKITADQPVYLYYDSNRVEKNIYGAKGAVPDEDAVITERTDMHTTREICGTWVSPTFPITGVLGTTFINASDEISATYQVSFDGAGFVGPDSTASTSFEHNTIIPYIFDNVATTAQLRVELCGDIYAKIESIGIEHGLEEIATDPVAQQFHDTTATHDGPLLRVKPTLNSSHIELVGTSGAPTSFAIETDRSGTQIGAVGGVVTSTPILFVSQPFSVVLGDATTQHSVVSFNLISENTSRSLMASVGIDLTIDTA